MTAPKILVLAGSIRTGSFNGKLAAAAARELALAEADVTLISLADYPMPLFDGNLEADSGPPENACRLKRLMCLQHGVFITSPEYNASITPLLKNTLDWVSRVRDGKEPPLAASNGTYGGMRSLMALRHVLELGCGALVIPEQVAVRDASLAFDDSESLKDERTAALLKTVVNRLIEMARGFA